jgi:hypothetical protein
MLQTLDRLLQVFAPRIVPAREAARRFVDRTALI